MLFFRILLTLTLAIVLTLLTQVGGLLYLACLPLFFGLNKRKKPGVARTGIKLLLFVGVYLFCSFFLIPPIAARFGRVPLPLRTTLVAPVKPLNLLTCLLNRHYVRPPLNVLVIATAVHMRQQFPGSTLSYLDANFPFWNHFPLIPHLSHNDGKKLDLAFFYLNTQTKQPVNGDAPSWLGYGVCEAPQPGEVNQPQACEQQGYWRYSLLYHLLPRNAPRSMDFDPIRTRELTRLLATDPQTGKIFIEPHLKIRLKLGSYGKIRLHGCQAVRHDDHLHVQIP